MPKGLRGKLFEVIFEAETPAGKAFDVLLLILILMSVLSIMLESVEGIRQQYGVPLRTFEMFVTFIFTLEYILRVAVVQRPNRYIFSFFGMVDLLAILPTYLSLFVAGTRYLMVIRAVRLLRVFRIFKLARYMEESTTLATALANSRQKIIVFIASVLSLDVIVGSLMYIIEGPEHGFTSVPTAMYWAIVTLTTVGYGDIAPATPLGKILAGLLMIVGYGIIAVPTGIVTVELAQASRQPINELNCVECGERAHDLTARFCRRCGSALERREPKTESGA